MTTNSLPIGRPSILRHANALRTLKVLRESGTCSRADLVRALGLSAPTITNVVRDLLAVDLVEPLGEGESSGGRPPDMIRFKAERGCILGVEISATHLDFLLTDLNGMQMAIQSVPLERGKKTPQAVCTAIAEGIRTLLRKQKKTRAEMLMLVVAAPAITNVAEGLVLSVSTLDGWRSVPLRSMLKSFVECPVIVENDTNLAAQGENYRGAAQAQQDFAFINIDANVSAGMFLDGKIHHGSQWSAGEIAYLRLPNVSRKHPTVHEFGELEKVLTSSGILASWREAGGKATAPSSVKRKRMTAYDILDLAHAGDPLAHTIVKHRSGIVADIVINLSLILNPSLILLGGAVGSHPALVSAVQEQLQGSEFAVTRVEVAALGSTAVLWGAIALGLDEIPTVLLPMPPL